MSEYFHCSVKAVSRAKGRSATAAAAYRAGAYIEDERTGEVHDYTMRRGILATQILTPTEAPVPDWAQDRARLWNEAEQAERRKDAKVAREIVLALPHELSPPERQALACAYGQYLADRYKVAVDLSIHLPDRNGDNRNHHAHLLISTREIGQDGFGAKTRVLDSPKTSPKEVELIRKTWANFINKEYARYHLDIRVDHRSYERQGIDQEPTKHLGPNASAMERRGHPSDRGDMNREIRQRNQAKWSREAHLDFLAKREGLEIDILKRKHQQEEERAKRQQNIVFQEEIEALKARHHQERVDLAGRYSSIFALLKRLRGEDRKAMDTLMTKQAYEETALIQSQQTRSRKAEQARKITYEKEEANFKARQKEREEAERLERQYNFLIRQRAKEDREREKDKGRDRGRDRGPGPG